MSKLERQGVQVEHVDESLDFRGFGSSCPRCPRCFQGPYGASIQELGVRMLFWRGVGAGVDFVTGYIAILMAETEPLMQAYYSHVKRRGPPQ